MSGTVLSGTVLSRTNLKFRTVLSGTVLSVSICHRTTKQLLSFNLVTQNDFQSVSDSKFASEVLFKKHLELSRDVDIRKKHTYCNFVKIKIIQSKIQKHSRQTARDSARILLEKDPEVCSKKSTLLKQLG